MTASDRGVYVSTVECLDRGEPPREDAGESSALLRLGTKLHKAKRHEDAIGVLLQALELAESEGTAYGMSTYLRLPRYLIAAKRADDAWGVLNGMMVGDAPGMGGRELIAHELGDINALQAKLTKGSQARGHRAIAAVCHAINRLSIPYLTRDEAIEVIAGEIAGASIGVGDPNVMASAILGDLTAPTDIPLGSDQLHQFLRAAMRANKLILQSAVVS